LEEYRSGRREKITEEISDTKMSDSDEKTNNTIAMGTDPVNSAESANTMSAWSAYWVRNIFHERT
jgi:hypothetical protein